MEFEIGNEKVFLDFVKSISGKDKIAIISHNDNDGIVAGLLIERVINKLGFKANSIDFLDLKEGMLDDCFVNFKKNKITKIFISDIALDSVDLNSFEKLRKEFSVLLIDHHVSNPKMTDFSKVIKAKDGYCCGYMIYKFGELVCDMSDSVLLASTSVVADMAYKTKECFDFVKNEYPNFIPEKIGESIPGHLSREISSSLIYFVRKEKKVYEILKEGKFDLLKKYNSIVMKEIDRLVANFEKSAEFFQDKKLYFYRITKPKFNIGSIVATIMSLKKPDFTFVIIYDMVDQNKFLRVNVRNQSGSRDLNVLMKKSVIGLENGSGGGHPKASGGRIMKKDIEKFKNNFLANC